MEANFNRMRFLGIACLHDMKWGWHKQNVLQWPYVGDPFVTTHKYLITTVPL